MGAGPDRFETAAETIGLFERPEPGDLRGVVSGLHKSRRVQPGRAKPPAVARPRAVRQPPLA